MLSLEMAFYRPKNFLLVKNLMHDFIIFALFLLGESVILAQDFTKLHQEVETSGSANFLRSFLMVPKYPCQLDIPLYLIAVLHTVGEVRQS